MNQPDDTTIIDADACVRAHTGNVAFAGALLVFFGFFWGLTAPEPVDLFSKANLVFFYTLRIGGVLMVLLAVWLSVGHTPALLCDAILSVLIGVIFAVTGIMMVMDEGAWTQTLINLVCGATFVSAGIRSGSDYLTCVRPESEGEILDDVRWADASAQPRTGSGSSQQSPAQRSSKAPAPDGYLVELAKRNNDGSSDSGRHS